MTKSCSKCRAVKPLDDFHRSKSGPQGRHSHCKACYKPTRPNAVVRRTQNLRARYGLTPADVESILQKQAGGCALCSTPLARFHVDHNHLTGRVRGLLCHRCNIVIGGWDNPDFRTRALAYMGVE
jgi:hypothetical protein